MSYVTNDTVLNRFIEQIIRQGSFEKRLTGGTLVAFPASPTETARITYHRRNGVRSTAWGPVTLCRYLPHRKLFLINGDGFTDNSATGWQSRLRQRLQQALTQRVDSRIRVLLVPYAAMEGAEIELDTVCPIQIREDTWDLILHSVPDPPPHPVFEEGVSQSDPVDVGKWKLVNEENVPRHTHRHAFEQTIKGVRFRITAYYESWRRQWRISGGYTVFGTAIDQGTPNWHAISRVGSAYANLHEINVLGQGIRRTVRLREHPNILGEDGERIDGSTLKADSWGWIEDRHHLGASIFSAVGEDGRRHKFISAFDEEEPQPLYYLAQLPDRSGVETYEGAIEALAPPIVRRAREEGKQVFRQGDVFAIEVDLTEEQLYEQARTRVSRDIAMFNIPAMLQVAARDGYNIPDAGEGEVSERIDCPCGCGHKRKAGCGPKARNALSIYSTGHTADEVVVVKKGATYIRGHLYHDPQIHQDGRGAEHRRVQLGEDPKKWFLAVRNTVPRRRRRKADPVESDQDGGR